MSRYYVLYSSNECKLCDTVRDFLERKAITCLFINVDNEGDAPPEKVFTYPVLFLNGELCAYGLDIIEHFQWLDNRP